MVFGRLITAAVTPFDAHLQVDLQQFTKLIDHLIEQQSDSIVVCGTTGEAPTLSDDEKLQLFATAVRHAAGRCKIIAGTGSNDTAHSIRLSQKAQELGVDGVLLVAPYYNRPSEEGLYQHFKAIADSIGLPVMLYNIPSRTNVNVLPKNTLRLAQIPNIVATKEAHSDLDHITRLAAEAPDGFKVYSGDDSLTLPFMAVGAYGIVSVASHVIGKQLKQMISLYLDGQVRQAAELHGRLLPVFKGLFACPHPVPNPVPVKYALNLHGIDVGGVRLPLVPATEEEGRFIASLFA